MQSTRTGGMTAMAVLNIIFGSLGALGSMLIVLGGGLLAAGSAAMEAELGAEAEGMAELGAMGGGIVALIGVISLVVCVVLFVAGIGLLKMAPWGRTLSIVCGFSMIGINVLSMLFGGIDGGSMIGIGYGIILAGLCFSETWKQAYSGNPQMTGFNTRGATEDVFDAAHAGSTGFAVMPPSPTPVAADPMTPMATPQSQSMPQGQTTPNPMPTNDEPAPGFASMPGIPAAPSMPEASFEAPPTTNFDVGDDPDENISDVAA